MISLNINACGNLEICREEHQEVVTLYDWCLQRFINKLTIMVDPDIVKCKAVICEIYEIYKYEAAVNSKYQTIEIEDLEDGDSLTVSDQECKQIIKFAKDHYNLR